MINIFLKIIKKINMKKIKIEMEHPVFIKSEAEELALLSSANRTEIFDYVCCHGFQSDKAQTNLALSNDLQAINLQTYVHAPSWNLPARNILQNRGLLQSSEASFTDLKNWLHHVLMVSPTSFSRESEYACLKDWYLSGRCILPPRLSTEELLCILNSNDTEAIKEIDREVPDELLPLFVQKAPIETLFRYIFRFKLNESGQCELIARGHDALTWQLVIYYALEQDAMDMIRVSGNLPLLYTATIRTYGWEYTKEKQFGSTRNWQLELTKQFNWLHQTRFAL